jgi:hypothetical protein
MVHDMQPLTETHSDIAGSAHQLQREAGTLQRRASRQDTVPALPAALAHLEETLDRLATSIVKTAHAVEEWPSDPEAAGEAAEPSPAARALRWHLFHVAARLRGAQDAFPDARRLARDLLVELPRESLAPPQTRREAEIQELTAR